MAPPQLARDAPVLNIVQPLVVGVDPVFRVEADLPVGHDIQCLLCNRFAISTGLAHGNEPLIGEHRLDHHARAITARHFELVLVGFFQDALGFQI